MFRKLFYSLFLIALFTPMYPAQATLEVSLTISGDLEEIQALLAIIQERNLQQGGDGENPLKVNVHSMIQGGTESLEAPAPRPLKLSTPQLSAEKIIPGQSALMTVAVRDDQHELDTLAIQVVGTNLSTDFSDLGTLGDVKANDGVWTVTLSPMEATPAGIYEVIVTGFDKNGQALSTLNEAGESVPLEARTEIAIER